MKARTGFALGIAVGYVLGAKAGRPRYEQIKEATTRLGTTDSAQAALEATAEPRSKAQQLLGNGLRATSKLLREN